VSGRGRDKLKGRRDNGTFFRIPTPVLDSPSFIGLSLKARALLLDLGAQFRGGNNGDIAAAWSVMRVRGWKSKDTLRRALLELLAAGLIEQTRWGGLHCASLYAFTWIEVHECGGKLDVPATIAASNKWRQSPQAMAA
jgi:hypothetical protein